MVHDQGNLIRASQEAGLRHLCQVLLYYLLPGRQAKDMFRRPSSAVLCLALDELSGSIPIVIVGKLPSL